MIFVRGDGRRGMDGEKQGALQHEQGQAKTRAKADPPDHILLLQTSLYHYEYILAQAQPAYLSHIRWSYNITRRLISKKILVLSTVTVTILPLQTVCGESRAMNPTSWRVRLGRLGHA